MKKNLTFLKTFAFIRAISNHFSILYKRVCVFSGQNTLALPPLHPSSPQPYRLKKSDSGRTHQTVTVREGVRCVRKVPKVYHPPACSWTPQIFSTTWRNLKSKITCLEHTRCSLTRGTYSRNKYNESLEAVHPVRVTGYDYRNQFIF